MGRVDPITLEVMRNRFFAIAEEMGMALIRTAYATNIKDRRDASCAVFSATGDTIAQAEHIPVHLGVLPWGVKGALKVIPPEQMQSGDAILHNDPYVGGTHTPDIIIFAPVFYQDRLIGYVGNLAHHVDVGGSVPGSLSPYATEIFQEGLRFPPVKLRKAGRLDDDIVRIHANNVRTVYESQGDLMAQLAANNVGERRLIELCEEFGPDLVVAAIAELEEYCDRRMAGELAKIPAGTYTFEDVLEGDGLSDDLVKIKVAVTAAESKLTFDFTGTSPQARGPINAVRPITLAAIYYAVKCVTDPSLPTNAGTFRRIEVITPRGSVVDANFPAATGQANGTTSQRVVDAVMGALAGALPDRVCAAATGSMNGCSLGGYDPVAERYFSHVETYGGGYGATVHADGASGVHTHMTNTRNAPVEVIETTMPLVVERYGLVPNSEGPGLHRGGFGIARTFRVTSDNVACNLSSDRAKIGPWGLNGGRSARGSRFLLVRGDEVKEIPSKSHVQLSAGDRLILETSGGGGWGDPHQRPSEQVAADVAEGLISAERARAAYGKEIRRCDV